MDIGNQQRVIVVTPLEAPVEAAVTDPKPAPAEPAKPVVAEERNVPAPA